MGDSSDRSKEKLDQKVITDTFFLRNSLSFQLCFLILVNCNQQTVRRLAQNREAARKSRLRKKVCLILCFNFSFTSLGYLQPLRCLVGTALSGICSAAREQPIEANTA